ncbi:GIY-YIG nuclease family protein [Nocardioides montaniterrae]
MSVYFAESGPYMKIGYSADPAGRMTTVTRNGQRPDDLPFDADADLIGWIPGDRKVERELHQRFASIRVSGEWFWSEREAAVQIIREHPSGVDIHGMSAIAVFLMREHPTATRADLEAIGVQVEAVPLAEAMAILFTATDARRAS